MKNRILMLFGMLVICVNGCNDDKSFPVLTVEQATAKTKTYENCEQQAPPCSSDKMCLQTSVSKPICIDMDDDATICQLFGCDYQECQIQAKDVDYPNGDTWHEYFAFACIDKENKTLVSSSGGCDDKRVETTVDCKPPMVVVEKTGGCYECVSQEEACEIKKCPTSNCQMGTIEWEGCEYDISDNCETKISGTYSGFLSCLEESTNSE